MAYLNGIDVSNWQKGINLAAVPADFVICKATEGTSYVSPDCARQVEQAAAAGKLVGTYHYITGIGAVAEADYYLNNISNWIGKYMLCLDWESGSNRAWGNESYLEQMVQRVIQRTGIPPMIYVQQSRMSAVKPVAQRNNCGLWIAQYANMDTTGYQSAPWNEGAYSCAMRQYSSRGRLNGYGGDLDLNKFYGDRNAWSKYANPGNPAGWVKDSVGWWYKNADGSYPKSCWKEIGGDWYYFDDRGYALSEQWFQDGGHWYYLKEDCRMVTGWRKVDGIWYYLNPQSYSGHPLGSMLDGWQYVGNYWYYLNQRSGEEIPHGGMLTGMLDVGDHTYYCRPKADGHPEGSMVTGWLKLEDSWYYCNKDNDCQPVGSIFMNHWHEENGERYYLKDDGKMACDETLVISGKEYSFDSSGKQV